MPVPGHDVTAVRADFVALGDSLSSGTTDPAPGGTPRGWARRTCEALDPGRAYLGLAADRAQIPHVIEQLPPALAALRAEPRERPGPPGRVATLTVGMNDLTHGTPPDRFRAGYRTAVGTLVAEGVTLITMTLPEPPALRRLPEDLRVRVEDGLRAYNDLLREVADEIGAELLDAASAPAVRVPSFWTADGLHPSPEGHALIAKAATDLLLG